MVWDYIQSLLGPGTHWGRSQDAFQALIDRAVTDNQPEAAEHLRMMLERRNAVMMEKPSAATLPLAQRPSPDL